ncbi:hypothetical protein D3C77_142350 [compost metagenome]
MRRWLSTGRPAAGQPLQPAFNSRTNRSYQLECPEIPPPHAARDANDSDQESFQVCERACKQLIPIETASDQLLLTKNPLPIQKIRA